MCYVARIQRAVAVIAVALALVVFLAFGALVQSEDDPPPEQFVVYEEVCKLADDYGECVESWSKQEACYAAKKSGGTEDVC